MYLLCSPTAKPEGRASIPARPDDTRKQQKAAATGATATPTDAKTLLARGGPRPGEAPWSAICEGDSTLSAANMHWLSHAARAAESRRSWIVLWPTVVGDLLATYFRIFAFCGDGFASIR